MEVAAGKGTPTGVVEFVDGAQSLGTAALVAKGGGFEATFTTSLVAPGAHTMSARYAGDMTFSASSSTPFIVTVYDGAPPTTTTTVLTSSPNPSNPGDPVTLTAVVDAKDRSIPTGIVDFYANGVLLASVPVTSGRRDATASLTTAALASGEHSLAAVYGGNTALAASTSAELRQCVGCATPPKKGK